MSGDNDIVARLREVARNAEPWEVGLLKSAADEIERLRAERDEARRRICEDSLRMGSVFRRVEGRNVECVHGREVAEMMGWDCFKEGGK